MKCIVVENVTEVIFYSDCSEFLNMLDSVDDWQVFYSQLDEFKSFEEKFSDFSIRLIPRCNNVCADCLASTCTKSFFLPCKQFSVGLTLS